MNKLLFLLILCCFTACEKESISRGQTNNKNISVDFLFEHDGIKVYRFFDYGRPHYFTSKEEAITSNHQITQAGKAQIHQYWDENIK